MTIRKIHRDREGIESLKLYASLDPLVALEADLQDPARLDEFLDRIRRGVSGSVQKASRLHGLRVEALFRAMLVTLGGFALLTEVDGGEPYFDDAHGAVKLPDFCVVGRDGQRLLVEVKNVPPSVSMGKHRIGKAEVLGLERYGQLMDTRVAVAHYWSAWNRWTLVGLDHLTPSGKGYGIDLMTAVVANELSRFGDCMLGTRPPLTLRLQVETVGEQPKAHGHFGLRVSDVEILAANVPLNDRQERDIALFLMLYGNWPADDPTVSMKDGQPQTIELSVGPLSEHLKEVERQGFGIAGTLSSMYSAMYNELTLVPDDGKVRQLNHEPDPGKLAALIPDDYWDRDDRALALWKLRAEPAK